MNSSNYTNYATLYQNIIHSFNNPNFLNYIKKNEYKNISTKEFGQKVKFLTFGLKKLGIEKNESVAIFANPSPFWIIFDFALQLIGAISVPVFHNVSSKNLNYEIQDSNIRFIFIDSDERIEELDGSLQVITLEKIETAKKQILLESLFQTGQELDQKNIYNLDTLINEVQQEDIFSCIYTSGNTGTPKGVQLSHKNIISQLKAIKEEFSVGENDRALSLLPLAHIFERTVMSFYLSRGVSIYFVDDINNVAKLMKEVKPTMMTVVPRLLEKIVTKMKIRIDEKKGISHFIAAKAYERAFNKKDNDFSLFDFIYEKLVYSKLRESFGGKLDILVSGGSSLDKDIYRFFVNIGLNLYQGYGMTEFSPVISTNYPEHNRIGTCGLPLKGVEVKLTTEKELLARGDSVMIGYKNLPELTSQTIDKDGWLHTGDLASIDNDGYITIQSRKKELFKTSTGEFVSAIPIEQAITKSHYVDFATVIAENKKYTTCLIFVDHEIYKNYIKKHKLDPDNFKIDDFYNLYKVQLSLQKHIQKINNTLNKWEQIVKYKLITTPISIETGELTPSMKVCRGVINKKYKWIIDSMYD